jgi:hypothetical protein
LARVISGAPIEGILSLEKDVGISACMTFLFAHERPACFDKLTMPQREVMA